MLVQEKVPKENDTPRLALQVPFVPHLSRGSNEGISLSLAGGAASMRRPYGPNPVSVPVLGCVEGGLGVVIFGIVCKKIDTFFAPFKLIYLCSS